MGVEDTGILEGDGDVRGMGDFMVEEDDDEEDGVYGVCCLDDDEGEDKLFEIFLEVEGDEVHDGPLLFPLILFPLTASSDCACGL